MEPRRGLGSVSVSQGLGWVTFVQRESCCCNPGVPLCHRTA